MKKIFILILLTIVNIQAKDDTRLAKDLTPTERILIDLYHDQEAAKTQNTKEVVSATKDCNKLVLQQGIALQHYEKTLAKLEKELNRTIVNIDDSLGDTDELILAQKNLLKQYKKINFITIGALSAISASALTMYGMKTFKENFTPEGLATKGYNWFTGLFSSSSKSKSNEIAEPKE